MPSLEIKNLNVNLSGRDILKDINLKFEGNKVYGIIGPNGSGKSTLLNAIYSQKQNRDSVLLNGIDVKSFAGVELAKQIAFMNQLNENLEGELIVRDLVMMGRYPYKKRFENYNDEDNQIVDNFLDLIGIMDIASRPIKNLSGGERQRAIVAKTLVQDTDIIMLDEPTNHIDIRYQIELMNILKSLDKLIIFTVHDISLAAKFCDEIVVLDKGSVLKVGRPIDVLTKDLLKDVYDTDFKILYEPEFIIYY